MSTTIDQKVVEMRFDNGQFERGVSQSISTLDKLKASLDFSGISDGISGLGTSITSINSKLSPFGEMWRELWSNAADVVWSAATSIYNATQSMGIDQMYAGFEKYSLLTKSVQTIMSATRHEWADQGAQMEYVSSALEKLNWFTDETSYSFTDMVSNIGKFTSASIPLDTAVTSMMGIATWAGISGAGIYEASRAMYNLSQAIAMGYVSVKDWMSIETANMATREFKQTAIDTAVELGYLQRNEEGVAYAIKTTKDGIEELEVTVDNFRTTLGSDYGYWFKADVLNAALDEYGGFVEELYVQIARTKSNATDLLSDIKDYKELLKDVSATAEEMGESNVDLVKDYIQQYYKGTLSMEQLSIKYGMHVDTLMALFEKYRGSLLDFNYLRELTDDDVYAAVAMKRALDILSAEEYELGYAATLASQESRTLQDAILGIQDAASSAWMRLFTTAMGDYLEATKLWADVYDELWDIFVDDLYNFTDIVNVWGELGGREVLIEAISNAWSAMKEPIQTVKEEFKELFPELTGERLYELTEKFKEFTENLGLGSLGLKQLRVSVRYVWAILRNAWSNISTIIDAIKDAFNEIFPRTKTGTKIIYDLTQGLYKLSENLKLTDEQGDKLRRIFKGVFAVFDILGQFISAVLAPVFNKLGLSIGNFGDNILDMAAGFGDWLVELDNSIRETDFFNQVIKDTVQFFTDLKDGINDVVKALTGLTLEELGEKTAKFFSDAKTSVQEFFGQFSGSEASDAEEFSFNLSTIFETITQWMKDLKAAWQEIKPYIDEMTATLGETFEIDTLSWDDAVEAFRKGGALALLFMAFQLLFDLKELFEWFFVDGAMAVRNFIANVDAIIEGFGESMWNLQKRIKAGVISKIARAILYVAVAIALVASIKTDKLKGAVGTIAWMFAELVAAFEILMQTTDDLDTVKVYTIGKALRMMGFAVAEMAIAMAILGKSFNNMDDLAAATSALGIFFGVLVTVLVILTDLPSDAVSKMSGISGAMAILGFALIEFAAALAIVALVNKDGEIYDAVGALALLLAAIAVFYELMSSRSINAGKMTGVSAALTIAGFALIELASSLAIVMAFSKKSGDMVIAAGALGLLLMVIGVFFELMSSQGINAGKITAAAGAMVIMGFALIEMAAAVALITSVAMNEGFGAGVTALIGMLVILGVVLTGMAKIANGGELVAASAALLIASVGIIALAYALQILSTIAEEDIMGLFLLLAGSLTILIGAAMFAEKCVWGLIAIGGAMLMIGLGALAAGEGMLKFAAGITLLVSSGKEGVDVLIYFLEQLGGLLPEFFGAFAEGLMHFITIMFIDNTSILLEALGNLLATILQALVIALPMLKELIKLLIYDAVDTIKEMTPVLLDLLGIVVRAVLEFLVSITPDITKAAITLLLDTTRQIMENIGELTALLIQIALEVLLGTIDGIARELPHIVDSIWNFVISLINAFSDGIENHAQELKDAIIRFYNVIVETLRELFGWHSPCGLTQDFGNDFIQGFIDGIGAMIESVKKKVEEIALAIVGAICDILGIDKPEDAQEMYQMAGKAINGLIASFNSMIEDVKVAAANVANGVLDKVCEIFGVTRDDIDPTKNSFGKIAQNLIAGLINKFVPEDIQEQIKEWAQKIIDFVCEKFGVDRGAVENGEFYKIAAQLIQGFISGIQNGVSAACEAVGNWAQDIIDMATGKFDEHSPSKVFAQIGRYVDEGFAEGVDNYAGVAVESTKNMAEDSINAMSTAISSISDMVSDEIDGDPIIRPVLDLTDVTNGANAINGMFNSNRTIGLAATSGIGINSNITNRNDRMSAFEKLQATISGKNFDGGIVNNNTFYITGDDPRAIANEVSRILQEDVERTGAVWA